jgi:hypothetical protein
VPEAGKTPDNHNIEYLTGFFNTIAAQGDIYIISEPGGKRNVPSAPEFGNAF